MGEPVFVRYWLLQLPGQLGLFALMWLLQRWLGFAAWVPFVVVGVWAAKDLALYPLVRGAYATGDRLGAPRKLVGEAGAAEQDLAPSGYVRVRGELWRAEADETETVRRGDRVRVTSVDGMTLRVRLLRDH